MNQCISHCCKMLLIFLVVTIHADKKTQLSTGDYSFVEKPSMSWFAAKDHCEGEGGKLVEIDSEEENTALVEEINKRGYADRKMHFWIGLTEMTEVEGEWRLPSSLRQSLTISVDPQRLASSGLEPSYLNWHEGEPKEGKNKHCARLRIGPRSSWKDTWSNVGCKGQQIIQGLSLVSLHALCEFEDSTDTETKGNPIQIVLTITVLVLFLLLLVAILYILKQRKARRRGANVTKTDENETYGHYSVPDQRMEVEDRNAYYSSVYGAATSRTTDNNPYYE